MGSVYITAFACTWMRAAALGSEELMRTGWEISMLCLLLSWAALWLTDRAVNEWRFLAFFFPSPLRWPKPFPLDGDALGEGPEEQGPNGAGSELGPGALAGIGLSISINCLAVSFNCEESRGEERGRELWERRRSGVRFQTWVVQVHLQYIQVCLCGSLAACSCWQLFRPAAQESSLTTAGLVRLPLCNTLTVAQTHRYSNNPQKGEHSLCLPEFTPFLLTNRWSCTCFKHLFTEYFQEKHFFLGGRHNQPDSLNRGLTCRVWGPPPNSAHRCR